MVIESCCAFTDNHPRKLSWGYNKTDVRYLALKNALTAESTKLLEAGYTDFLLWDGGGS